MTTKQSDADFSKRVKESLVWNTVLPISMQVFRFVISIFIARLLNPVDFGIMGIAGVVVFYADSFTNFGFSTAIVQRKDISERHIQSIFTINLAISLLLTAGLWFSADGLARYFNLEELKGVLRALSIIFILTTFYTIPVTLLRRNLSFKTVSQMDFLRGATIALISLALAWMGFEYWALVIGLISTNLLSVIVINLKVSWRPRIMYDHQAVKEIINYAGWSFINAQLRLLNDYIDKFFIGKALGPVSLGYYEKAFGLAFMPVESVANRIGGVMFSTFSRYQSENEKLLEYVEKATVATAVLCFPLFVGLLSVSSHFTIACLGEKWAPMIPPLDVLLLSFALTSLTTIPSTLSLGAGRYKTQVTWRATCLVFLIVACYIASRYEILYVAYAVLAYSALFMVGSFQIAKGVTGLTWRLFIASIAPAASGTIVMYALVASAARLYFPEYTLSNLAILVGVGAVAYTLWMACIDFPRTRFLRNEVFRIVKSRLGK